MHDSHGCTIVQCINHPVPTRNFKDRSVASREEIRAFMAAEFPQNRCIVEHVGDKSATVKHHVQVADLRPGGTVSGPVLMMVADVALYVALLGEIGIVALAVTSNLSINFLRKPSANADIVGVCKLVKVGRLLAVGEVALYSEGNDEMVAHVVGTYAIPPEPASR
jgi:acyl-coenzyme A thioesterase PaaI-like protein